MGVRLRESEVLVLVPTPATDSPVQVWLRHQL